DSTVLDRPLAELLKIAAGDSVITSILRSGGLRIAPLPDAMLRDGDIVLIEGSHEALDRLVGQAKLGLGDSRRPTKDQGRDMEAMAIEAVIGESSSLIGWSAQRLLLYDRLNVNLLAVSRKGERLDQRLGAITLRLGDVVVLQGNQNALPEFLREFGLLP